MNVLLVSTCKEKLHELEFVKPFSDYIEDSKIIHYKNLKNDDLEKSDKIIICGTGLKDNKFLEDLDKFPWLKKIDKPILGICSGIQIIASTFNGKINENKEIGFIEVTGNLFGKENFKAYSLHGNGITNLENFDAIAKSDNSIQAIKHKEKEIYGVSFHPEVRNMWIIDEFLKV